VSAEIQIKNNCRLETDVGVGSKRVRRYLSMIQQ